MLLKADWSDKIKLRASHKEDNSRSILLWATLRMYSAFLVLCLDLYLQIFYKKKNNLKWKKVQWNDFLMNQVDSIP